MPAIRKNSNTGIIFGVCAGISEWSGIHVHLVRVVTVVGMIVSLSIVGWLYLFLAGILSDTAECNASFLPTRPFKERIKLLLKPWWKKDFNPAEH